MHEIFASHCAHQQSNAIRDRRGRATVASCDAYKVNSIRISFGDSMNDSALSVRI
jgi:hypothetical protein